MNFPHHFHYNKRHCIHFHSQHNRDRSFFFLVVRCVGVCIKFSIIFREFDELNTTSQQNDLYLNQ